MLYRAGRCQYAAGGSGIPRVVYRAIYPGWCTGPYTQVVYSPVSLLIPRWCIAPYPSYPRVYKAPYLRGVLPAQNSGLFPLRTVVIPAQNLFISAQNPSKCRRLLHLSLSSGEQKERFMRRGRRRECQECAPWENRENVRNVHNLCAHSLPDRLARRVTLSLSDLS